MSHVHNISCSLHINKALTNHLVQHTIIEATGFFFNLCTKVERNARELCTSCPIHIYPNPFKKGN